MLAFIADLIPYLAVLIAGTTDNSICQPVSSNRHIGPIIRKHRKRTCRPIPACCHVARMLIRAVSDKMPYSLRQ